MIEQLPDPTSETGLPDEVSLLLPQCAMERTREIARANGMRLLNTLQNIEAFEDAELSLFIGRALYARSFRRKIQQEQALAEEAKRRAELLRKILR